MWVTQAVLESLENNTLKWYGHGVRIVDKIWGNRIMTRSLEGRRPEVKWERKIESLMKQRNLTTDDAVNRQLWRLKTGNRWVAGKHR